MKKYRIEVDGCDDSTVIFEPLMDEEYALLNRIAKKITETSTYGCMPRMSVRLETENDKSEIERLKKESEEEE